MIRIVVDNVRPAMAKHGHSVPKFTAIFFNTAVVFDQTAASVAIAVPRQPLVENLDSMKYPLGNEGSGASRESAAVVARLIYWRKIDWSTVVVSVLSTSLVSGNRSLSLA